MVASRLQYALILLFILIVSHPTLAQDQFINKEIYLRAGAFRLDSLLANITQQTGVVFSYNAKKFDSHQRVRIASGIKDLKLFLEVLKKQKGFSIKVIENYVVITSASKEPMQSKLSLGLPSTRKTKELKNPQGQIFVPQPKMTFAKDTVQAVARDSISKAPSKIDSANVKEKKKALADTLLQSAPLLEQKIQKDSVRSSEPPVKIQTQAAPLLVADSAKSKKPAASKRSLPKFSFKKDLFLKSGVTLDESSFMGVAVQAGLPFAYATVSANSNLLAAHVRYGLGTSIKLNPRLRMHLVINDGDVSRSGFFTDTLGTRFPIAVKSNLLRLGLGVEFRWRGKFSLQAILNFNQLTTTYFINQAPSDLSLFSSAGDNLFYTITPPYLISNTFSPHSDSNVKTWVGLQFNFLYRINFY